MNKEEVTDEEIKKIIQFYYDGCDNFDYEREYTRKLEVYINQLKQKAELGDHYKHLYSEVKKQKDDGLDWIKNNFCYVGKKMTLKPFSDLKELLRMLGEIDE